MKRTIIEMAAFLFGYLMLKFGLDAPDWGACIGGWMVMWWTAIEIKK